VEARKSHVLPSTSVFADGSKLNLQWENTTRRTNVFRFPPEALLNHLVEMYFAFPHVYLPLLHRQTFERGIGEGLHLRWVFSVLPCSPSSLSCLALPCLAAFLTSFRPPTICFLSVGGDNIY
jgi:hypothetical protein